MLTLAQKKEIKDKLGFEKYFEALSQEDVPLEMVVDLVTRLQRSSDYKSAMRYNVFDLPETKESLATTYPKYPDLLDLWATQIEYYSESHWNSTINDKLVTQVFSPQEAKNVKLKDAQDFVASQLKEIRAEAEAIMKLAIYKTREIYPDPTIKIEIEGSGIKIRSPYRAPHISPILPEAQTGERAIPLPNRAFVVGEVRADGVEVVIVEGVETINEDDYNAEAAYYLPRNLPEAKLATSRDLSPEGIKAEYYEQLKVARGNFRDERGFTKVMIAAEKGLLEEVKTLVAQGADLTLKCHKKAGDDVGDTVLHIAVQNGRKDIVEYLIGKDSTRKARMNIDTLNGQGFSALMTAINTDGEYRTEIPEILIKAGADLTVRSDQGSTLWYIASAQNPKRSKEMTEFLIGLKNPALNALIDVRHNNGYNALSAAIASGNNETANILIEAGADPTAKSPENSTLWHIASSKNPKRSKEATKFLIGLENPALNDLIDVYKDEVNALTEALARGNIETANILIEAGSDPTAKSQKNSTHWHVAAKYGDPKISKAMTEFFIGLKNPKLNALLNTHNQDLISTPLLKHIHKNNFAAVERLIEVGADVTVKSNDKKYTPWHMLQDDPKSKERLEFLIGLKNPQLNALVNDPGESGGIPAFTPLSNLVTNGILELAKILITEVGADVTAKISGNNLWHLVAQQSNPEQSAKGMRCLAELKNPDLNNIVNEPSPSGKTALEMVAEKGHLESVKILVEQVKVNVAGIIHVAASNEQTPVIEYISTHAAESIIDERNSKGFTALMWSAQKGKQKMVESLVGLGADPKLHNGLTAQDYAQSEEVKKYLQERTSLPASTFSNINNPVENTSDPFLRTALSSSNPKSIVAVNFLVEDKLVDPIFALHEAVALQRVDVLNDIGDLIKPVINEGDKNGMTPLMSAAKSGNMDLIKCLEKLGADLGMGNGFTALNYAKQAGKEDVAKYLETLNQPSIAVINDLPQPPRGIVTPVQGSGLLEINRGNALGS